MRKLIAIILFAINIQNLSTNTIPISKETPIDYYKVKYQIYTEFSRIVNKANKILNTNSMPKDLPISFPIDIENYKRISGRYGIREKHPILGYTTLHNGIDIVAPYGENVYAAANGIISRRGYHFLGYGKFIKIEHKNKVSTIYAHLSAINVSIGDTVRVGDLIGKIGSTGLSTGNHLHYEIRKYNYSVDPFSLFLDSANYSDEIFVKKSTISKKFVQMNQKTITKSLTLAELKELKDEYTENIVQLEYSIKNNEIKELDSLEKIVKKIEVKHENLIRIKELLAKANSIESSEKDKTINSNNTNIYKLSLMRDLRNTLNKTSENEKFKEYATKVISSLTSQISDLNENIKSFNTSTKVEIELLKEI